MEILQKYLSITILLVGLSAFPVFASTDAQKPQIGISEKNGEFLPKDVELYDEQGNLVTLGSIQHKPTIFTFVYFRCAGICNPLLTELTKTIDKMDLSLGKDYQIITVSFDTDEKPDLASAKRLSYFHELKNKIDSSGWHFYTGDSVNIRKLTDAAGFYYERSGSEWLHAGALIITSPEGKITRYLNGTHQLPFDVKLALIEASEGRTGPTIAKILEFCYSYDPAGQTYAMNITRISLVLVLGFVGTFIIIFIIRPKRTPKQTEKQ